MSVRAKVRTGFTLIELLVVIAIIAVLIALLLPAVQQAREAARRSQCKNSLKQIGLAMHNYHDAFNQFPPGYITGQPQSTSSSELTNWGWGAMVLPYIDQAPLYNQLNPGPVTMHANLATAAGLSALQTPLTVFKCPSDTGPNLNNFNEALADTPGDAQVATYNRHVTSNGSDRIAIATSNYVMVACSSVSTTPPSVFATYGPGTGIGLQNGKVGMKDITDGSSNTLMVGERAFRFDNLNVGAGTVLGFSSQTGGQASALRASMGVLGIPYNGINWSANNRQHQPRGFSSNHVGGAHFVMGDGAVRFISENIDYNSATVPSGTLTNGAWIDSTYERLCGKSDGGVIGDF